VITGGSLAKYMNGDLPFTVEQFFEIFAEYNRAVYPMQILLNLLAIATVVLAIRQRKFSNRIITVILAFFWLWMGIVYHFLFFSRINKAAYFFGALSVAQAIILLLDGVRRNRLSFRARWNSSGFTGALLIAYAVFFYPLLGYFSEHEFPSSPIFGVPCPTTIFTFGVLLWTDKRVPLRLLIIPLLWSFIGFSAVFLFGVYQDVGLPVAGIVATVLIVWRDRFGAGFVQNDFKVTEC
jgi:hypothetical protein